MVTIPVIDVGPALGGDPAAEREVAAIIDRACREVGFFVITGHGVDAGLVERVREVALAFFDLDETQKLAYQPSSGSSRSGYVRSEALSYSRDDASPPDLKESFTVHRAELHALTTGDDAPPLDVWPVEVPAFEDVAASYFAAVEDLAGRIMRLFAIALDMPADFFAPMIDRSLSALRMLHYPPLEQPPLPGQLRAGAHTDFGSLTLLLTDEAAGGLEVKIGETWTPIPHVAGAFVVNVGDLMAQWTNDRWISTMHRVNTPEDATGARRLSIAFFHQPNHDVLIEPLPTCREEGAPPRYAPITSGEHLITKVMKQRAMGKAVANG